MVVGTVAAAVGTAAAAIVVDAAAAVEAMVTVRTRTMLQVATAVEVG